MDFYDNRYFRIPKMLQISVGLWPYHPSKKFLRTFWLSLCLLAPIPQLIGVSVHSDDVGKLMEHICLVLVPLAIFMKMFALVVAEDKCVSVYTGIVDNWAATVDVEERKILEQYSERGRTINIVYLGFQSMVYVAFHFSPLIPVILNVVYPLDELRPYIYALHGEFLVENQDGYYLWIYLWDSFATTLVLAIGAPIDATYTCTVEHLLGLFAIVGYRLLDLKNYTASHGHVVDIIKLHRRALEFADIIEQQYSLCFLMLILAQLVMFPLICNLMLMSLGNPVDMFRYGMFAACMIVHLFNMIWPGQKLIDHNERIFEAAYFNEWYNYSLETRKILRVFMLRSLRPCVITGGGLTVLNFENYFATLKTAISYVTVFASFR